MSDATNNRFYREKAELPPSKERDTFDADLARVEQIKRAHSSAKPKTDNPAWWNCHQDMTVLLAFIDNLWTAYMAEIRRTADEPPAECDGCEQYAVMHAEIALALDIHDETDAHGLQELILKKLRAMAEPTWPHPYGYIRSLISEAVERAEIDLMAIGHGPDGQDRTAAMKDLENWKAKLQDAWIHGDLEVRRATQPPPVGPLKLDTAQQVFFYEQDHYYLSNFSAFRLNWQGWGFDTSEAAYHWEKFPNAPEVRESIRFATSAHEAFKVAERYKALRRPDWDLVKVGIMKAILCQKALQHEYVSRKLLETGDRELIENSWRDNYWGWGPNRDGLNMLGKLWMEVRAELRASTLTKEESQ